MNEGLFLCQLAADKSGANVMKLPLHNINLHCARPLAELHIFLSRWLTYSPLVLHNVIPPMLLGEVRCQHIKAASKLREHHVIGVTCEGQYWITTLYSGNVWKGILGETDFSISVSNILCFYAWPYYVTEAATSPCLWIRRASSSLEPRSWARSKATSSCIRPGSPLSPWVSHSPPLNRDPLRALRASALGNMQWTKWILDLRTMSRRASWKRKSRVRDPGRNRPTGNAISSTDICKCNQLNFFA